MDNAWPLWALPFWTMGVPLIWAVYEKMRLPKVAVQRNAGPSAADRSYTAPGIRPMAAPV